MPLVNHSCLHLVLYIWNKFRIFKFFKVVTNSLEDQVARLYDMHDAHATNVIEMNDYAQRNLSRLGSAAKGIEADIDTMTLRFQTLEELLSNYAKSSGNLQSNVQLIREESKQTRNDLDSLRYDLGTVKAESKGADVLMASVQNHISELTSNITTLSGNLTQTKGDVSNIQTKIMKMDTSINLLNGNVADNRNGLLLADEQFQMLKLNSSTLKANIIGLGNYINNINGDVGKLANSFETFIGDITKGIVKLSGNVSELTDSLESETNMLKNRMSSVESMTTDMKGEIATLTTKTYTMKTNLFEHQTEISSLKADHNNLVSTTESIEGLMIRMGKSIEVQDTTLDSINSDLSTLRTGLTSLTNSLFNIKTKIVDSEIIESKLEKISSNISAINEDVTSVKSVYNNLEPKVSKATQELTTFKSSIRLLAGDVSNKLDPARFSCSVTSDEIRTSGVITYNICNVNKDDLMDKDTGHISIKQSGDYFLTFTANMVSVNAQAVWCALYKQSAGNEGWQVLGMINNYQRNGNDVDDRDSASLTVITSLKKDDQVWVEWRGYGDSFLYSNPYRLISFTGFMLKQS